MDTKAGVLYVVATPIGNLADLSQRARNTLMDVHLIAAEDTRETRRLLTHLGISTPLRAYHDHNEANAAEALVELLASGRDVALVSDAGTPLISDPGFRLVSAARERGIPVVPIPGPNAAICALSAAGLPSDRFLFLGFPPRSSPARQALLESVAGEPGTLVVYESGNRAPATLADIAEVLGEGRRVVIARELTKRFETFLHGSASELQEKLTSDPEQRKGELVILVERSPSDADPDLGEARRVLAMLCEELSLARAVALAARLTGLRKNRIYRLGLEMGLGGEDGASDG